MNAQESTSTRPYLIRALYEWCTDNGLTPYVAVQVDESVQVPREFVKDGEIVLNVSYDATSALQLGNDFIEFKARFGGKPRDILVPVSHVIAIYARENGQGMAFPPPQRGVVGSVSLAPPSPPLTAVDDAQLPSSETAADEASSAERVVQLVPNTTDDDSEPPPSPPPSGARPALKRVK